MDTAEDPEIVQTQGEAEAAAAGYVAVNAGNFPDAIFREYVKQFDTDNNGVLRESEIKGVTRIDVSKKGIGDLKGIEFFESLAILLCYENQLGSLDVSKNVALYHLACNDNQLRSLDVSKNTALDNLWCSNNQLSSLDVSKNTALSILVCEHNSLGSLDVSKNTALTVLDCCDNRLSSLDVSKNTALFNFSCNDNQLRSLDVSKNTDLGMLGCSNNQLSSLDVSKNTALFSLACKNNRLGSLDLSNNSKLGASTGTTVPKCDNTFQIHEPVQKNGVWQMNLAGYVGSGNLDRVKITLEGASLSGETVLFGETKPTELTYTYDTKAPSLSENDRQMKVTMQFSGVHDMVTVVDQEATCGKAGSQHQECKVCGYKDASEEIPATGEHKYGSYIVDQEATCGKAGSQHQECEVCGYKDASEEIPATGEHKFGSYVVDQEATCGKAGSQHQECEVCGYKKEAEEIPATGEHKYGSYVVTKAATVKEEGVQTRTCTVCGNTETETIPKLPAAVTTKKISGLPKKLTLAKGKKQTLKPVITPSDSQDKVTYKSSNKKVATVSAKGVVKGKKAGKAKITVTSGKKKVTVTVTVKK